MSAEPLIAGVDEVGRGALLPRGGGGSGHCPLWFCAAVGVGGEG